MNLVGINIRTHLLAFAYEAGIVGIGIYSARNKTMKLFKFDFAKWFKLTTPELQNVLAYAITKKTVAELEAEQQAIRAKLNELRDTTDRDCLVAADGVRNLHIMDGVVTSAIMMKTPVGGEKDKA